jgi:outer membrane receptor for monomeric catechols
MPLFVRSLGGNRVEVFGGLRSASGGSARIESKAPGGSYRSRGSASVNSAGYFRSTLRVTNAVKHTFRVTLDGRSRTKQVTR